VKIFATPGKVGRDGIILYPRSERIGKAIASYHCAKPLISYSITTMPATSVGGLKFNKAKLECYSRKHLSSYPSLRFRLLQQSANKPVYHLDTICHDSMW